MHKPGCSLMNYVSTMLRLCHMAASLMTCRWFCPPHCPLEAGVGPHPVDAGIQRPFLSSMYKNLSVVWGGTTACKGVAQRRYRDYQGIFSQFLTTVGQLFSFSLPFLRRFFRQCLIDQLANAVCRLINETVMLCFAAWQWAKTLEDEMQTTERSFPPIPTIKHEKGSRLCHACPLLKRPVA